MVLEIDGSMGEGGGQVLRTSLAVSLLTGVAIRIVKVRQGRPKPGLARQHLTALRAAQAVGRARVEGDFVGSRQVTFDPGSVEGGEYVFDVETAGSSTLVFQTVLLPLLPVDAGVPGWNPQPDGTTVSLLAAGIRAAFAFVGRQGGAAFQELRALPAWWR